MGRTCVCKDCTKRELGCHGRCKDYQEFKAVRQKISNERRKSTEVYETLKSGRLKRMTTPRRKNKG